jgi:hypothetical protein
VFDHLRFIFVHHFWLALDAAILFVVGLFAAMPVVRYRLEVVKWLPLKLFRGVVRLMGDGGVVRTAAVIWLFNSVAIFVYMASGFHPLLPKLFVMWTGLNIVVLTGGIDKEKDPVLSRLVRPAENGLQLPRAILLLCGLFVLVLELPCFWFAIGMGVRMGHQVQAGARYVEQLSHRAVPYVAVIVPLLLVSAIAEAIAIRGTPVHNGAERD